MSTTKEHLDRIAALTTERNAVVILLRAKTDTATWGKYPETLQAAVEAEYAALTVERDQAKIDREYWRKVAQGLGIECFQHARTAERITTLEAENLALRSEEWLCVLCRTSFGERRAALSPVDQKASKKTGPGSPDNPATPSPSVESAANRESIIYEVRPWYSLATMDRSGYSGTCTQYALIGTIQHALALSPVNEVSVRIWHDEFALPNPPTQKDEEKASNGLSDLAEECECCGRPATKRDVDGIPLCDGCYEDLKRETNALASPSEEPK